jgi:hypothetical protein
MPPAQGETNAPPICFRAAGACDAPIAVDFRGSADRRSEQGPPVRELPQMRRARLARKRRKRRRIASRMLQLTLPGMLRTLDLEPLLRPEVLSAIASVLRKPSEITDSATEPGARWACVGWGWGNAG